ncbi:hypothetical protein I5G63_gp090 [Mycobacterium phage Imvubu]|uniref:Uncharacterized protein n=1 Tax=Mycobacterium phage Imvubu TaxID=2686233 RepID=A0A6B9L880_9CAUD|nr:hypothetical protein I5G63_gp090 [Mycobacterium phage Imvubu]QHB37830.1 hypothetical protein PBI_IMVUBU_90 [Mycobacterium phage Imvubu]
MQCPGVGERTLPVWWTGPHGGVRYAAAVACAVCGKRLAPRKDGVARKHAVPARPTPAKSVPAKSAPLPRAGRVITQK